MTDTKYEGFTDEERGAMKERARELKSAARRGSRGKKRTRRAPCSRRSPSCRNRTAAMATRLHEIIKANAPVLAPRLYYGMPAYAKDGKVLCFFQPAQKFKTRYATLRLQRHRRTSTTAPCCRPRSP